jgi:hypothetical protein
MIVLNEEQVQYILRDLESKGIDMEELRFSLLDHICCVLEEELDDPGEFRGHYEKVLPRFFKRQLSEIQEETELLIRFKHYYAMKRTMIISAGITAFTFITGALFKIMHWPGASVMILLSIVTLCFVFLPILFLFKTKETNSTREKITLGVATIFGITISLATLFKIMHWPGANLMWLSSLGFLFFIFLPLFFFSGIRKPETKLNTIISSVLILVAIGLLFALTQLRSSKWTDYSETKADLQLMELSEVAQTRLLDTTVTPEAIHTAGIDLVDKIDNLKKGLILHMNNNEPAELSDLLRDLGKETNQTNNFFFDADGLAKPEIRSLAADVKAFYGLLSDEMREHVNILNTEKRKRYDEPQEELITWEEEMFSHVTFSNALRKLNHLELTVSQITR